MLKPKQKSYACPKAVFIQFMNKWRREEKEWPGGKQQKEQEFSRKLSFWQKRTPQTVSVYIAS